MATKSDRIFQVFDLIKSIKVHTDIIELNPDRFYKDMNYYFTKKELDVMRSHLNKAMDSFGYIMCNTTL